ELLAALGATEDGASREGVLRAQPGVAVRTGDRGKAHGDVLFSGAARVPGRRVAESSFSRAARGIVNLACRTRQMAELALQNARSGKEVPPQTTPAWSSVAAAAIRWPSGENATEATEPTPGRASTSWRRSTSHSRTAPTRPAAGRPPETSRLPSGLKAS